MPKVKLFIPEELYRLASEIARARGLKTYTFLKEIILNELDRVLAPVDSLAGEAEKSEDTGRGKLHRVDLVVAPRDLERLKAVSIITGKPYSQIARALILRRVKVPQAVEAF